MRHKHGKNAKGIESWGELKQNCIRKIKIIALLYALVTVAFGAQYPVEKYTFSGCSSIYPYSVRFGQVSNSLYYLNWVYFPPTVTAIRKINQDNTLAWMKSFTLWSSIKSLSVNTIETKVCFAGDFTIIIICLDSSNGDVISSNVIPSVYPHSDRFKIHLLSDGSGCYIFPYFSNYIYICKYVFSTASSAECQRIPSLSAYTNAELMLDSTHLVFSAISYSSPYYSNYYKVTFGNTPVDWASKVLCSTISCNRYTSEMLVDSTNTNLYCFSSFGYDYRYLHFIALAVANGSLVGSHYISSQECGSIYGSAQNGVHLVIIIYCSGYKLLNINTSTNTFSTCSFSGNLYGLAFDIPSGMFVVSGRLGSNGYITKFLPDTCQTHPDFTVGQITMVASSSPDNSIIQVTEVTIDPFNTFNVNAYTYSSTSPTYTVISSTFETNINTGVCGDGVIATSGGELCDDGNTNSGDGCSSACRVESGYECAPDSSKDNISKCNFTCGNGVVGSSEQCDDENIKDGDGCSKNCVIELGYECVFEPSRNFISYCSKTCGNSKIDGGENCDDGNYSNGDGCTSDCKVEDGYKCDNFSNKQSYCYPICGDGHRDSNSPYNEECDDGNNIDLDGCSSTCKIELGFNCTTVVGQRSTCVQNHPSPYVIKSLFNHNSNQIILEFDQKMMDQNLTDFDMILDGSGPNNPYTISWSASFNQNILKIDYTVSPLFLGFENEMLFLQITNVANFKSEHDIAMINSYTVVLKIPQLSASESVNSGGSGASYMLVIVMLLSIGVSLITGGSIEIMWSLANTLQVMFYYKLLNLYFSPELSTMFYYMRYSNFDNPAFEWIQSKLTYLFRTIFSSFYSEFEGFGYHTSSVLINFISKMIMVSLFLELFGLVLTGYLLTRKKTGKFANFIRNKEISLRYEGMSRFFVEIILQFSVVNFINLIYGDFSNIFNIISYVISIIFTFGIFFMLGYCFIYPIVYYQEILIYPDFHERHCFIFYEFNLDKQRNLFFYAFFILHRICFAFLLICMYNIPFTQCILICVLNLWVLIYTFKMYRECLSSFLHTFNSIIQFVLSCCLPLFLSSENPNKTKISGYQLFVLVRTKICIGIIACFFIVNLCLVVQQLVVKVYRKIKECCHTKTQEEIENEMRSKTIIRLPTQNRFNQSIRSNVSNQIISLPRNEKTEREWNNVVIERIRGPNYFRQANAARDRRIEEQKKKSQELRRNRQISEWSKF